MVASPSTIARRPTTEESIPDRVLRWASQHPDRIAVTGPAGPMCWRDLVEQARSVASAVLRNAPADLSPVALLMPCGTERVAAVLGVLLAGRTVVPLDAAAPTRYLMDILQDVGARALLVSRATRDVAEPLVGPSTLCLAVEDALAAGPLHETESAIPADRIACVFYTSGSTGSPKGVCHSHETLLANARSRVRGYALTSEDTLAAVYSPSSGGALATWLSAWWAGGVVYLADEREGVHRLRERLAGAGVTVLALIVSSFRELARTCGEPTGSSGACIGGVRLLSLSGESLHADDLADVTRVFGRACIAVNSYATTETGTVCRALGATAMLSGEVTLGRPVDGVEVLLLDDEGLPIPGTGRGQIAVRGPSVSPGYWRRPDLDALAFRGEGGDRHYLTGDIGSRDESGTFRHGGRLDGAVNIDGRLVDVDSVERALVSLPEVVEAAVVPVRSGRGAGRLEAHVVLGPGAAVSPSDLRARLAQTSPATALPSSIRVADALPRLPGGKLDRQSLRDDASPRADTAPTEKARDTLPSTEVEMRLASLFADALGVPQVGLHDDFFELGGHSLLAVSLLKTIEERFHRVLTLPDLLAAPDVARLASRLDSGDTPLGLSQCIQLAGGGDGVPVFCVCGLLLYRSLAQELGARHPVHAVFVQAEVDLLRDDAEGRAHRRSLSVEELASAYVREIRDVRPHGPYHLLGESFGGLVAFEVAHQLRNAGEDVLLVGLLDTTPPGFGGDGLLARLRQRGRRIRRWLRDRRDGWRDVSAEADGLHGRSPAARRMEASLRRIRDRLYRSARRRYRLAAYSGHLAFFRALGDAAEPLGGEDPSAIWKRVAFGGFDTHDVPGSHIGILEPPHVGTLARALLESMARAEDGAGPDHGGVA